MCRLLSGLCSPEGRRLLAGAAAPGRWVAVRALWALRVVHGPETWALRARSRRRVGIPGEAFPAILIKWTFSSAGDF